MKLISDSDFSLLALKLPIVLIYARRHIPASDVRATNAARRLTALCRKLSKQSNPKQTNKPV